MGCILICVGAIPQDCVFFCVVIVTMHCTACIYPVEIWLILSNF